MNLSSIISESPVIEKGKCSVLLTKGKRKGTACNRKITDEEQFCKFHVAKNIPSEVCPVILTKGERKNQTCERKVLPNGKLCKMHQALEDRKPYNPYVDYEYDVEEFENLQNETNSIIDVYCQLHI